MLVVGLLPLLNPNLTALSATTDTGTLMLGMGPPILFLVDIEGYRPLSFHVPVFACAWYDSFANPRPNLRPNCNPIYYPNP